MRALTHMHKCMILILREKRAPIFNPSTFIQHRSRPTNSFSTRARARTEILAVSPLSTYERYENSHHSFLVPYSPGSFENKWTAITGTYLRGWITERLLNLSNSLTLSASALPVSNSGVLLYINLYNKSNETNYTLHQQFAVSSSKRTT